MYRLMIIDDESSIRTGIKTVIDWQANGILVCGEASNGREAFELFDELKPDIILVDIKMPVINGLQLIETVNQMKLPVKSIILSGYDDFTYAQKALKLGASDYLLKPCQPQEILETVLKVKSFIEHEKNRYDTFERLKSQFKQNVPILKEKYLSKLLDIKKRSMEKDMETFNLLEITFKPDDVTVILIRIDNLLLHGEENDYDMELIKFAIKNITEELVKDSFLCEVCNHNDDIIIIASVNDFDIDQHILPLLNEIKKKIKEALSLTVSMGIGRGYSDLSGIYTSFQEALKSIDTRFFLGEDSIISYEDSASNIVKERIYPISEEKELLRCVRSSIHQDLKPRFQDFYNMIHVNQGSKDDYIKSALALVLSLYHLCIELNIDVNEDFGSGFSIFDSIMRTETADQLENKLFHIVKTIFDKINTKRSFNKIIEQAVKYIEENYYKDLTLETVAGTVYITPGYLSLLFKQVMGINFLDYLHEIRIDKACEMLQDKSLKTYQIATKVGYNNDKYFFQIFKKYRNMTPTQYRDNLMI